MEHGNLKYREEQIEMWRFAGGGYKSLSLLYFYCNSHIHIHKVVRMFNYL